MIKGQPPSSRSASALCPSFSRIGREDFVIHERGRALATVDPQPMTWYSFDRMLLAQCQVEDASTLSPLSCPIRLRQKQLRVALPAFMIAAPNRHERWGRESCPSKRSRLRDLGRARPERALDHHGNLFQMAEFVAHRGQIADLPKAATPDCSSSDAVSAASI